MIRTGFGMLARSVIPATMLMVVGAAAGNAAALSAGGLLERAYTAADPEIVIEIGEGNQPRLEHQLRQQHLQAGRAGTSPHYYRHRHYGRRHYRSHGLHIGIYPFGYYQPYAYSRPRYYSGGSCGYWSRRCAANWGWRNGNYYGCMRYHGC